MIRFVGHLRAKRTAKKVKEMDAQRKDMIDVLYNMRLSILYADVGGLPALSGRALRGHSMRARARTR